MTTILALDIAPVCDRGKIVNESAPALLVAAGGMATDAGGLMQRDDTTIPNGFCQCGCGQRTPLAKSTRKHLGTIKGQPIRFMLGHGVPRTNTTDRLTLDYLVARTTRNGDCWEWQRGRRCGGYGTLKVDGRSELAHRVAYAVVNGPIPDGLCVLHHCDNPPCINPEHLFLGTKADNNRDKQSKGRARNGGVNTNPVRGVRHGCAKLTEGQVVEIRQRWDSGESQTGLALEFSVDLSTVHLIVHRKRWKHLP